MKILKIVLYICIVVIIFSCHYYPVKRDFVIRIIHVNDHHSHIEQNKIKYNIDNKSVKIDTGGFAKISSSIKDLKTESVKNHRPVLTLHAGDALQGTMYYTAFKGKSDAAVMNETGFDAFVLGNHEFDDGDKHLANFLDLLEMPVLSSNIIAKKYSPLFGKFQPYIIKEINGEKVGIIGVTIVDKTINSSNPGEDIIFYNEKDSVKKYVKVLQKQGVNKIILLSHIGYYNDLKIANSVSGIDVIVGGDSHSLLGNFDFLGLKSSGDYPTKIYSPEHELVCVVQAWEYAKAVGVLDVIFDKDGVVLSCKGNLILPLSKQFEFIPGDKDNIIRYLQNYSQVKFVKNDENMLKTILPYKNSIIKQKKIITGHSSENILHTRIPGMAYNGVNLPLGSELAPLICKAFYNENKHSDLCIQNAGGVRQSIYKGEITLGDIYNILPFSNTLYEIKMTGDEIKKLLENAIDTSAVKMSSTGSFPYCYGIKYDINLNKSFGKRVSNLEVFDKLQHKWVSLKPEKIYSVVTHSYLIKGKDGYRIFEKVSKERGAVNTYIDYATSFMNFISRQEKTNKGINKLSKEEFPIKSYKGIKTN